MDILGNCKVIRVYIDENLKWGGQLLYKAIVNKLLKDGFAGATVFHAIEGFGSSAHLHTARIIEVMENIPIVVEVIDKPERALKALNLIEEMLPNHCMVTVQDTTVLHYHSEDGKHAKTSKWED